MSRNPVRPASCWTIARSRGGESRELSDRPIDIRGERMAAIDAQAIVEGAAGGEHRAGRDADASGEGSAIDLHCIRVLRQLEPQKIAAFGHDDSHPRRKV